MSLGHRSISKINITPNTGWAKEFWDNLIPFKDQVVNHVYFQEMEKTALSVDRAKRGFVDFYPLIENFPKYMALNLPKTHTGKKQGHLEARFWIMQNMKVEQKHADWWVDWAASMDVSREELDYADPSPLMDAINNYLWYVNTYGSLAEGIAATNLAIEWATGEWVIRTLPGVKAYAEKGFANMNSRALSWMNAHATYDDKHPYEAMEVIKLCAENEEDQKNAFRAAQRALEYYVIALNDCYEPLPSQSRETVYSNSQS